MAHEKKGARPFIEQGGQAGFEFEGLSSAKSKRGVRVKSVGKGQSEEGMWAEYIVSIRSRRVNLLDPDNLYVKDIIDQLRYARLIPEDTPEVIEIEITQEKVSKYKEEETIITLIRRNENGN
tara:strand:- start:3447 stop:3812 length:366 start_codon:yes stop_codon:yes gene_type:complete